METEKWKETGRLILCALPECIALNIDYQESPCHRQAGITDISWNVNNPSHRLGLFDRFADTVVWIIELELSRMM